MEIFLGFTCIYCAAVYVIAEQEMPLGKPLLDTLERISCGGVVFDASGHVLRVNRTAELVLKEFGSLGHTAHLSHNHVGDAIKRLLLMNSRRFALSGDIWTGVQRSGKRQLLLHSVKLDEGSAGGADRVVILVDLDLSPALNRATVQDVFELTAAEADIATGLAGGKALAEIAIARGISIATARTQLASIFAKTHTRRQAELVALLTRISILP